MKITLMPPDGDGKMKGYTDFNPIEHGDLMDAIEDAGISIEEIGVCEQGSQHTGFIIFPALMEMDRYDVASDLERLGFKTEIA